MAVVAMTLAACASGPTIVASGLDRVVKEEDFQARKSLLTLRGKSLRR